MVHGVIDAPEALADPSLARMVGEGTGSAFGRGYGLAVQRFGASVDDKRCAVFYWAPTREMDGEIGMDNMEAQMKDTEEKVVGLNERSPTELTDAMVKRRSIPGSQNGTGTLQAVIAMKIREVYDNPLL